MDFYGLFLGVEGATSVIRLELDIDNDDADPAAVLSTGDLINIAQVNYYEMPTTTTSEFRLL